jgi:hypothetical protein
MIDLVSRRRIERFSYGLAAGLAKGAASEA